MGMDGNKKFRRNWFPLPKFQIRFLIFLVCLVLFQIAATNFIVFGLLKKNEALIDFCARSTANPGLSLNSQVTKYLVMISAVQLVFLLVAFAFTVIFSQRIGGPIFALQRAIENATAGNAQPLQIREKDEFKEIVESYNKWISSLKG
jgi:methyl-accepting chemotaxis protein